MDWFVPLPWGGGQTGILTAVAYAGSYLKKCPHGMVYMADLTPDKLWPAFREVLAACRRN